MLDIDVIIAPITSQLQQRNEFDVVLEYWKDAGLLKPSITRDFKDYFYTRFRTKTEIRCNK